MTSASPKPRSRQQTTASLPAAGSTAHDALTPPALVGQAPSPAPDTSPGEGAAPRRRNKPKAIGTADESAVVRALHRLGFPQAERRALRGHKDAGDILVCPGIIAESKGGAAGRKASDGQILAWLAETEDERVNAGAAIGFLITPRNGVGPANAQHWWVHVWLSTLLELHDHVDPWHDPPVRLRLNDWAFILRRAGYGEPLTGGAA